MAVGHLGAAMALLVLGGVPGPRTTYTTPVFKPAGDALRCIAQNIGTQPVLVEGELRGPNGTAVASGQVEVAAGRTAVIAASDVAGSGYCTFTFDADAATLRGYIERRLPSGDTTALYPAFSLRTLAGPMQTTTPPLRSLGTQFACLAQNLGAATVEIETELIDADGAVVDSTIADLAGGHFAVLLTTSDDYVGLYCRFTLAADAGDMRGYATISALGLNTAHLVLPASAAQMVRSLTLWSPAVSSLAGDATICGVQNLDSVALTVDAEIVDASGTVLDTGTAIVPPGHVDTVAGHTEAGLNMVCRFTFSDGEDIARAFITRFPPILFGNTDLLELAVQPGRDPRIDVKTYSPPVRLGADGFLQCAAVNLTDADTAVHVEIDDGSGGIVAMQDLVVPAGLGQGAAPAQDLTDAFCTFAFDANPDDLRGYATLTNETLRTERVFAAAPPGPSPIPTPTATATATVTLTATPVPTRTHTATPSATATAVATDTATAVATATPQSTATASPPSSSTPTSETPTSPPTTTPPTGTCTGDCDGNGMVSIDELVTLVNVALGAPLALCPAGDRNADGTLTIDELVVAVIHALEGCPA